MRARVEIAFRDGVFDPEAAAILRALGGLGFAGVREVRRTKVIELDLKAAERSTAEAEARSMCERLLANPVIETFRVSVEGVTPMAALYETDYFGWTRQTADLLRQVEAGETVTIPEIDWLTLAGEIESLGRSMTWELYGRYKLLLVQLLRAKIQPGLNSGSFRILVSSMRYEIRLLLRDNPTLRAEREEQFRDAWPSARMLMMALSGFAEIFYPKDCPFSLNEVEDEDFWPEANEGNIHESWNEPEN